ncbi:uncharacterized protein FOMMEDRAFT_157581 [Fomitiporia mediterranea MF3/22]|uniref:uncharacterized protein n=1 Tax=Fomitiporia mediterranea (strain MF3/22) TaxID=694068 RepID=UPI00044072F9|nr:uncharacterized protein FOMMEDRAFT_157581 [Fomitiporia mediterranea MF3/22]EJD02367.1 hypothetical protein FOMMEDRAFT_157581 [Fomitiporia mediterranea MF3/22]
MSSSRDPGFDSMMLAKFASLKSPETVLPPSHYFCHTSRTITVFEQYPKSKIHFLLFPRVGAPPRVPGNLKDILTLLTSPEVSKSEAEALLREMREDAEIVKGQIEEEMMFNFKYKPEVWIGFKVAPSFRYLHLHVMTDDLTGKAMKTPRHFFSFHPNHGEFLPLDEVLSWFEIVDERYKDNLRDLRKRHLKFSKRGRQACEQATEDRRVYDCYHRYSGIECRFEAKDLPTMKKHLDEHFEKRREEGKKRQENREKFEERQARHQARLAEEKRQESEERDGTEAGPQAQLTTGEDDTIHVD